MMTAYLTAITLALSAFPGTQPGQEQSLESAKRILFLGDSITYDGRYVAYFEAWLAAQYPARHYEVINAGLPSETVSGLSETGHASGEFPRPALHERLRRVLEAVKPDLILACYGMNCGIYQPFDVDRFARYQAGIAELRAEAVKAHASIIFITPPAFDHAHGQNAAPDYNDAVLGAYARWLLEKREEGWTVIDLHGPMTQIIAATRKQDPHFTFQPDGIHPNDAGHWFIARQLIGFFGGEADAEADTPEAMLKTKSVPPKVLSQTQARMGMLRDAWLSHTGHQRPGLPKGLPLEEARQKAAALGQ